MPYDILSSKFMNLLITWLQREMWGKVQGDQLFRYINFNILIFSDPSISSDRENNFVTIIEFNFLITVCFVDNILIVTLILAGKKQKGCSKKLKKSILNILFH